MYQQGNKLFQKSKYKVAKIQNTDKSEMIQLGSLEISFSVNLYHLYLTVHTEI